MYDLAFEDKMCGIFGYISNENVVNNLVDGLTKLEYRGYDSSGVAVINQSKSIKVRKAEGKIISLKERLAQKSLEGNNGIAHTRWATHGKPNEINAHPHSNGNFAVVHNGIIENFRDIKEELMAEGYKFKSETDTEVIPNLIDKAYKETNNVLLAIRRAMENFDGAFALGIISKYEPDKLYAVKRGSPLAIGLADKGNYIASDAYAIAEQTNKICYLNDDDIAILEQDAISIYDKDHNIVKRELKYTSFSSNYVGKGDYRHFMQKEINEQPAVISDILRTYCDRETNEIIFPKAKLNYKDLKKITFVACGSSYYSALIAKYWLENIANVSCKVEIASEFLYTNHFSDSRLVVFISQSGETADSLAALKMVKKEGVKTLVICNSEHSSMANIADYFINILAGPEIGVASTKAFTAQLTILALLTIEISFAHKLLSNSSKKNYCRMLRKAPKLMNESFNKEDQIIDIANLIKNRNSVIYLGRGASYGLAHEAALKLKEISYIHAEGIAAGELKHGPIALIDENLFIVAILPNDNITHKTISNLEEVKSRGGKIIVITEESLKNKVKDIAEKIIILPEINSFVSSIIFSIPIQLLAYHTAVAKGTDVDQPRNLAKSVTVE
ncbi:MAG: glutamine--fructose-6-phosphate transaminase (isomerizing) [Alphaproteobacteria bacterium]|jgi:glutamine---fructose-6-phosphate transaminase (isomerizing)|nr:glutamine--fructose-6-phosphate transaminase (isomerizing) [Alphaproteobacteria bacterium]MBT5828423.1 glutamine--fructose-6-phosphate transaminase (isomerizing) [Alphaproteobacteria bacterium]